MSGTSHESASVSHDTATTGNACPHPRWVELTSRPRIPTLVEMMRSVSSAASPADIQASFGRGMRRMHGIDGYISASVRDLEAGSYKITRKLLEGVDRETEVPNPWRDWESLAVHRGGFFGSIIARGEPALIDSMEIRDDDALGDDIAEFRSLIAIPLFDGGSALNWSFFLAKREHAFDAALVEQLLVQTNLIGGTVKNVLVTRKLREADAEKTREMNRIAAIQRRLLPTPLPTIPGAGLGASFLTFDTAGGDLYAVREVRVAGREGRWWLLVIADASGHGPSAAVVSAMVDAIVSTIPEPVAGPGAVLETLNEYLTAKSVEHGFVTAFAAMYCPISRDLIWARAGHNPPLLRSACHQRVRLLDEVGDIPLGIAPGICYEETTTRLAPLETLVLYTDGITEARNPDGEMFGVERIEESLRHCSGAPACAVQSIGGALVAFEAGVRPGDDQTLLVLQVEASSAAGDARSS
jgi:sigma-B regulation protein RsbU (phosphoserine phosphatase)